VDVENSKTFIYFSYTLYDFFIDDGKTFGNWQVVPTKIEAPVFAEQSLPAQAYFVEDLRDVYGQQQQQAENARKEEPNSVSNFFNKLADQAIKVEHSTKQEHFSSARTRPNSMSRDSRHNSSSSPTLSTSRDKSNQQLHSPDAQLHYRSNNTIIDKDEEKSNVQDVFINVTTNDVKIEQKKAEIDSNAQKLLQLQQLLQYKQSTNLLAKNINTLTLLNQQQLNFSGPNSLVSPSCLVKSGQGSASTTPSLKSPDVFSFAASAQPVIASELHDSINTIPSMEKIKVKEEDQTEKIRATRQEKTPNQQKQKDNVDKVAGKSESQECKVKSKTKYHDFLKKLEKSSHTMSSEQLRLKLKKYLKKFTPDEIKRFKRLIHQREKAEQKELKIKTSTAKVQGGAMDVTKLVTMPEALKTKPLPVEELNFQKNEASSPETIAFDPKEIPLFAEQKANQPTSAVGEGKDDFLEDYLTLPVKQEPKKKVIPKFTPRGIVVRCLTNSPKKEVTGLDSSKINEIYKPTSSVSKVIKQTPSPIANYSPSPPPLPLTPPPPPPALQFQQHAYTASPLAKKVSSHSNLPHETSFIKSSSSVSPLKTPPVPPQTALHTAQEKQLPPSPKMDIRKLKFSDYQKRRTTTTKGSDSSMENEYLAFLTSIGDETKNVIEPMKVESPKITATKTKKNPPKSESLVSFTSLISSRHPKEVTSPKIETMKKPLKSALVTMKSSFDLKDDKKLLEPISVKSHQSIQKPPPSTTTANTILSALKPKQAKKLVDENKLSNKPAVEKRKGFLCGECGRSFPNFVDLEIHVNEKHTNIETINKIDVNPHNSIKVDRMRLNGPTAIKKAVTGGSKLLSKVSDNPDKIKVHYPKKILDMAATSPSLNYAKVPSTSTGIKEQNAKKMQHKDAETKQKTVTKKLSESEIKEELARIKELRERQALHSRIKKDQQQQQQKQQQQQSVKGKEELSKGDDKATIEKAQKRRVMTKAERIERERRIELKRIKKKKKIKRKEKERALKLKEQHKTKLKSSSSAASKTSSSEKDVNDKGESLTSKSHENGEVVKDDEHKPDSPGDDPIVTGKRQSKQTQRKKAFMEALKARQSRRKKLQEFVKKDNNTGVTAAETKVKVVKTLGMIKAKEVVMKSKKMQIELNKVAATVSAGSVFSPAAVEKRPTSLHHQVDSVFKASMSQKSAQSTEKNIPATEDNKTTKTAPRSEVSFEHTLLSENALENIFNRVQLARNKKVIGEEQLDTNASTKSTTTTSNHSASRRPSISSDDDVTVKALKKKIGKAERAVRVLMRNQRKVSTDKDDEPTSTKWSTTNRNSQHQTVELEQVEPLKVKLHIKMADLVTEATAVMPLPVEQQAEEEDEEAATANKTTKKNRRNNRRRNFGSARKRSQRNINKENASANQQQQTPAQQQHPRRKKSKYYVYEDELYATKIAAAAAVQSHHKDPTRNSIRLRDSSPYKNSPVRETEVDFDILPIDIDFDSEFDYSKRKSEEVYLSVDDILSSLITLSDACVNEDELQEMHDARHRKITDCVRHTVDDLLDQICPCDQDELIVREVVEELVEKVDTLTKVDQELKSCTPSPSPDHDYVEFDYLLSNDTNQQSNTENVVVERTALDKKGIIC